LSHTGERQVSLCVGFACDLGRRDVRIRGKTVIAACRHSEERDDEQQGWRRETQQLLSATVQTAARRLVELTEFRDLALNVKRPAMQPSPPRRQDDGGHVVGVDETLAREVAAQRSVLV
jgi:hypothetical protein